MGDREELARSTAATDGAAFAGAMKLANNKPVAVQSIIPLRAMSLLPLPKNPAFGANAQVWATHASASEIKLVVNMGVRAKAQRHVRVGSCVTSVQLVHTTARNCARDEGGPFGVGNHGLISSHCKLLWPKAMVVSVAVKSGQHARIGRTGRGERKRSVR